MADVGGAVVVGLDGSEASLRAGEWAAGEARRHNLALLLAHCFPGDREAARLGAPELRLGAERLLEQAAARLRQITGEVVDIRTVVLEGPPAPALVAESRSASLMVVASRGHGGFTNLLVGSTSVHVAARAACPVTVVREGGLVDASSPVLVGVDASEACRPALEFAFARAAARGTGVVALHAWQLPRYFGAYAMEGVVIDLDQEEAAAGELLADTLRPLRERFPRVAVEQHVVQGHPVDVLAEASGEGADVVVVGSRGRSSWSGLVLGSVSQGLLRHARRPVVVTR